MRLSLNRMILVVLGALGWLLAPAGAAVLERTIPLGNGEVPVSSLISTIGRDLGAPAISVPFRKVDLRGDKCDTFCRQFNDALAPGGHAVVEAGALRIRIDTATTPTDAWTMQRVARLLLTGDARPAANTASRYGLTLPADYDPARSLIVLIHGLDSDSHMWGSMVNLLQKEGYQVASFNYPDDGPIAKAGLLLADGFADLRIQHPGAKPVTIIGHSMGGLVARHYIEGSGYRGGVSRLIMLGTPNYGSTWTGWRWATEWNAQYKSCRRDGGWTWSKLTEDGNGEAATDLAPDSAFLKSLNAYPRRDGVKYTIVAGDRSAVRQVSADWIACTADYIPQGATHWWGLRQAHQGLVGKAQELRRTASDCDGPVSLASAKLEGVADFVVVSADHTSLACGHPPAAWEIIKARLKEGA